MSCGTLRLSATGTAAPWGGDDRDGASAALAPKYARAGLTGAVSRGPQGEAAIDAAIAKDQKACGGWADWWGADTMPDTPAGKAARTGAKAEIWSDAAGFEAAGNAYVTAESAVLASTDEASFKAAFPALGKACGACHEKFRQAD